MLTTPTMQIYTDKAPYPHLTKDEDVRSFLRSENPVLPDSFRPYFFNDGVPRQLMPQVLWDLLKECWKPFHDRPTSAQIVETLESLTPKIAR